MRDLRAAKAGPGELAVSCRCSGPWEALDALEDIIAAMPEGYRLADARIRGRAPRLDDGVWRSTGETLRVYVTCWGSGAKLDDWLHNINAATSPQGE